MDSQPVLARFEAERQALALMDHPNIAKVFDGGVTDQGHPFFVMEYVKGVPLTDYCDGARLSLKERLKLFITVCQAVQHAHHKGIVHRDLKPSNILVSLHDGSAVPKVIDFGLAKALHQPLTGQTLHTAHGLMLGTPLYMSPEQAEYNNLDVDTRTDIYSLGVVLYELLTGTTPLERKQFQKAAYDEILRLIKQVDPPRPSTRLSGAATLSSIAAQRSIDPRRLARSLTGDLDWIVMKSLDKERSRRYETANGFARDIERFLNEEPVEACPPSTVYRVRKFINRHRGQVSAAAVVIMSLLVGTVGTSIGLRWAWIAQRETDRALNDVKKERDEKGVALSEKSAALEAKSQALLAKEAALQAVAKAREEVTRQRDAAERNLLQSILRPIGHNWDGPDEVELASIREWSRLDEPRLKLKLLEVAFDDASTALRVARRAEYVVQACVGLNPSRHAKVMEFVSARQRDRSADRRIRFAACWIALALGSHDLPALGECIGEVEPSATTNLSADFSSDFTQMLTSRTDPTQRHMIARACRPLIPRITKHKNQLHTVVDCLCAFSPELDPADVAGIAETLVAILTQERLATYQQETLIRALTKLHSALTPSQAAAISTTCLQILKSLHDLSSGREVIEALVVIEPLLDRIYVLEVWDTLVELGQRQRDEWQKSYIVRALSEIASRRRLGLDEQRRVSLASLEQGVADQHSRQTLAALLQADPTMPHGQAVATTRVSFEEIIHALKSAASQHSLFQAYQSLSARSSEMTADQNHEAGNVLLGLVEANLETEAGGACAACLTAWAARLNPLQTDRGRKAVCAALAKRIPKKLEFVLDARWDECLKKLTPRLSEGEMVQCFDPLVERLTQTTDANIIGDIAERIERLFLMVDPDRMAIAWKALLDAYEQISDTDPAQEIEKMHFENRLMRLATTTDAVDHRDALIQFVSNRIEHALSSGGWYGVPEEAVVIIGPKAFAEFFSHPDCVGFCQQEMLKQFESYVWCVQQNLSWPPSEGHPADALCPTSPRRFHTMHDAAVWIQENWPDFDVEAHP